MPLFNDTILHKLALYARNAALDAGIAAMRYYRQAFRHAPVLGSGSNPSTEADIQATLAALNSLGNTLHQLDPDYRVYGEELDTDYSKEMVKQRMNIELPFLRNSANVVRSGAEFISGFPGHISVLMDGIDGTTNFRAGLPIFCSAIAVYVDGCLRVGAVYDPHHHIVYYGVLPENDLPMAHIWHVASGENPRLTTPKTERELLIATHFTRGTDPQSTEKRAEMLQKTNQLMCRGNGHYQLNSGQLALTYVAAGILSGFVNNYTNPWDIAAAQVLIEAVGGCVTHFNGKRIDYNSVGKIDVLAAGTPAVHAELQRLMSQPAAHIIGQPQTELHSDA
ncbi:MAG: inositol monophosphatase [Desulfobacteraceae bacterium]|nr:MAG: inositol monophosphatase [Desulfobacteraceae bacterium]